MNLNDLKISTRLALGFGTMQLLLAALAGISYLRLAQSSNTVATMVDYQQRAAFSEAWMAKTQLNVGRTVAVAKAGAGTAQLQKFLAPQIEQTSAEISALQKTLQASITSEAGKALLASVADKRQAYISARTQVFAQLQSGDAAGADSAMTHHMLPASQAYLASMAVLQKFQREQAEIHVAEVATSLERAKLLLFGLLLGGMAAGAALAWSITVSITRPLREAVASARVMADSDLSRDIVSQRRDELGDLLRALAHMQGALRGLVGQVRNATDSISTASAEIAVGNQDLSMRTEQTASNLQQAASSMDQLTGTVRQGADSARTANQLASSAASVAAHGGEVVSQVVATMDEINASSKKIADIIGVIDGIAFQTNILALNAAVEAARAGEQGRGFAVVASEVRSLAQRSAGAAREIKALIGASVERVESGSKLVADAGSTMAEIVASVQRVSDIIGEISAASSEQSDDIGLVNTSVTQLDQMTQQNAALVEQSAAAAESLKDQAQRLAGLMATFQLGGSSMPALPAPLARPTTAALQHARIAASAAAAKPGHATKATAKKATATTAAATPLRQPAAAKAAPAAGKAPAAEAPAAAETAPVASTSTSTDTSTAAFKPAAKAPAVAATTTARAPAGGGSDGDWETF